MSKPITIHLVIPHLLSPLTLWQRDFGFEPKSAHLLPLINNSVAQKIPVQGLEHTLLYLSGYSDSQHLPWAAIRYAFDTGTRPEFITEQLLCADPVYLESHLEGVNLSPHLPKPTPEETRSLLTTLNKHLAQDDLQLIAPRPEHWYLKAFNSDIQFPKTSALSQALGQNIRDYLPKSPNPYWRRLLNELQMLLYNHPVNQQREQKRELPMNSLWLWGEGAAQKREPTLNLIQGGGSLGQVMATYQQCARQPTVGVSEESNQLVIADQLTLSALSDDPYTWQQTLHELEHQLDWLWNSMESQSLQVKYYDTLGDYWTLTKQEPTSTLKQKLTKFWAKSR